MNVAAVVPPVAIVVYIAPAIFADINTSTSAVPDKVGLTSLDKSPEMITSGVGLVVSIANICLFIKALLTAS